MKSFFVIREDINYSSNLLFKIAVQNSARIENNREQWIINPEYEVLMIWSLRFLYELELKLLEDGIYFKWIEEDEELIGIMIEPTDLDIINIYLSDSLTLDEYAIFRTGVLNELKMKRVKKEREKYK